MPVDFEPYFLSEINPVLSAKLEDVVASIQKNKVCIKVSGENLNLKVRNGMTVFHPSVGHFGLSRL